MSFNIYGKQEDTSYKLKLMNKPVTQYKKQTLKLEDDTDMLTEQLQGVKATIDKDLKSDTRWHNGNAGYVRNYAKEVVNQQSKVLDMNQKRKLRLIKSEKMAVSKETNNNYEVIMNKNILDSKNHKKSRSQRCGQCDERNAQVSCIECGEDYCAACFAAFHLKGALKKHRTKPVGMDRLTTPRPDVNERNALSSRQDVRSDEITISENKRVNKPPTLLWEGNYDETESSESFQEALNNWRQSGDQDFIKSGKQAAAVSSSRKAALTNNNKQNSTQSESTETVRSKPSQLDIVFSNVEQMTYAEQLLLKKFRRKEYAPAMPSQPKHISRNDLNDANLLDDEDAMIDDDCYDENRPMSVLSDILPIDREKKADNRHINKLIMNQTALEIVEVKTNSNPKTTAVNSSRKSMELSSPQTSTSPHIPKDAHRSVKSARNPILVKNNNDALSKSMKANHSICNEPTDKSLSVSSRKNTPRPDNVNNNNHNSILNKKENVSDRKSSLSSKVEKINLSKEDQDENRKETVKSVRAGSRPTSSKSSSRSSSALHKNRENSPPDILTLRPTNDLLEIAQKQVIDHQILDNISIFGIGLNEQKDELAVQSNQVLSSRESNEDKLSNKFYQLKPSSWHPQESICQSQAQTDIINNDKDNDYKLDLDHFSEVRIPSAVSSHRSGRKSQPIVVDGDDMTFYDYILSTSDAEDADLQQNLDEQLAKEVGTTENSLFTDIEDTNSKEVSENYDNNEVTDDNHNKTGYLNNASSFRLRESQLMFDFEEMEALLEEDEMIESQRSDAKEVCSLK